MGYPKKYIITPEIHEMIKEVYNTPKRNGLVKQLSERVKIPVWKISHYAVDNDLAEIPVKHIPWSSEELRILQNNARYCRSAIKRKLKDKGFTRSEYAIKHELRKNRFSRNLKGQTASQLSECFGVCPSVVEGWIHKGYLKADRRGTDRDPKKDFFYITNRNIINFIKENIDLVDLKRVDKYWFIDLALGGKNGLAAIDQSDSVGFGDNYMDDY